jgi:hypothetical protein
MMKTRERKSMKQKLLQAMVAVLLGVNANAQVNSGSNGSDGAFNPATNTVINIADHPNGIYQYTSVNIPSDVNVTFIPNANNTPVVWLVQSNVVINGIVDVSGKSASGVVDPGQGGPGGSDGGSGGQGAAPLAHRGAGWGGGDAASGTGQERVGGGGSYATRGVGPVTGSAEMAAAGQTYGNKYLLPLLGGSGGGGGIYPYPGSSAKAGGGGGGGSILVVSDSSIVVDGALWTAGGSAGGSGGDYGGGGSGGGIRLVAPYLGGKGTLSAPGGHGGTVFVPWSWIAADGGMGFVRLDALDDNFVGSVLSAVGSRGFNPVLIPPATSVSLRIQSVGGAPVAASPSGQLATPDAVLSAQQNNPIPIVVHCSNLPLNTPITVTVRPANGSSVSAVGYNSTGTQASSTATVSLNMPRGGGILYATAVTGN